MVDDIQKHQEHLEDLARLAISGGEVDKKSARIEISKLPEEDMQKIITYLSNFTKDPYKVIKPSPEVAKTTGVEPTVEKGEDISKI